jgi:uncharacterized protein YegL
LKRHPAPDPMKLLKTIFSAALLALILLPCLLPAQGTASHLFIMHVRKTDGTPLAGTEVEFVEMHTRQRILKKTDATGTLRHEFTTGNFWQFNILDVRDYYDWQIVRKDNVNMQEENTYTYCYPCYLRETRPPVDRSKLNLVKVPQSLSVTDKPTETEGMLQVNLHRKDKSPLTSFPVEITCYKLQKTFSAKTNAAGIAVFRVPVNNEYEIDLEGINSFSYVDIGNIKFCNARKELMYVPTAVNEKVVNDTVHQMLDANVQATSSRVLVHLYMKQSGNTMWGEEPVYLTELNGTSTWEGKTDVNGMATFLLPKGKSYMIHGKYERDIDVLNFMRNRGIGYDNKWVLYRPLDQLQNPGNYIPTPDQLIVSEFQNFIRKQYPGPTDGNLLRPDHAWGGAINAKSRQAMLRLSFTAADAASVNRTVPLNICFVLDKSGSMAGEDRIEQLKESMYAFLDKLRPDDIVSLITFESFETVLFQSQKLAGNEEKIKHAMYMLEAGGGTVMGEALRQGYSQVAKNYKPGITNRVILLTDGFCEDDPAAILAMQKPFTDKGIGLSAVGVGEWYNAALLQLMVRNGGGLISHVGDSKEMQAAFLDELASEMYPVATDVEVTVEYNDKLEYRQLHGFPLKEKGKNVLKMKLPTFYAGMNQLALLQFKVLSADPSIGNEPVKVTIRYKDLRTGTPQQMVSEIPLRWSPDTGVPVIAEDEEEKMLMSIAVLNAAQKVMAEAFVAGDRVKAKLAIENALAEVAQIYPNASNEDVKELMEKVKGYYDILSKLK